MTATDREGTVRRVVLVSVACATLGLVGVQCRDMWQYSREQTRLYREFNDAAVIARDLTNGGWIVHEAPPLPGPYRLIPGLSRVVVPPGVGETRFHARLGGDVIDIRRELPRGRSYEFVPLETADGRLTYMVLGSESEANPR